MLLFFNFQIWHTVPPHIKVQQFMIVIKVSYLWFLLFHFNLTKILHSSPLFAHPPPFHSSSLTRYLHLVLTPPLVPSLPSTEPAVDPTVPRCRGTIVLLHDERVRVCLLQTIRLLSLDHNENNNWYSVWPACSPCSQSVSETDSCRQRQSEPQMDGQADR